MKIISTLKRLFGRHKTEPMPVWDGRSINYDYSDDFSGGNIEPSRYKLSDDE